MKIERESKAAKDSKARFESERNREPQANPRTSNRNKCSQEENLGSESAQTEPKIARRRGLVYVTIL